MGKSALTHLKEAEEKKQSYMRRGAAGTGYLGRLVGTGLGAAQGFNDVVRNPRKGNPALRVAGNAIGGGLTGSLLGAGTGAAVGGVIDLARGGAKLTAKGVKAFKGKLKKKEVPQEKAASALSVVGSVK